MSDFIKNETISVKVERILYPRPDAQFDGSCFYILKTDVCTVKGKLTHIPKTGERLSLNGKWEVSKYNGSKEFVFFHATETLPADERSMLRYACEMTPNFGPAMEEKIWAVKGDDWRRVGEADGIKGLTPSKLAALQETIKDIDNMKERSASIAWLMSIGLTTKMAESAVGKWGRETVTKVKENCYILAKLPNYGFKDVDSHIRLRFQIGRDDPRRIDACLKYYVDQLTQENTVCSWPMLYEKTSTAIDSTPEAIARRCKALFDNSTLVAFPGSQRIASQRDYQSETMILAFIKTFRELPHVKAHQPKGRSFDLDETQMDAVQFALDHSFSIINGGAGCGKTTLIKAICDSLRTPVELCAFAGKAAARLKEACGRDAGTIHRLLRWEGEGRGFALASLNGYTVILDEASMVSADLMGEIIKREPDRLILVGDEAQLPPVGSGQPFHDIIHLYPQTVRTLTTCYRNREAIFSAALKIRNGEFPEQFAQSALEKWQVYSIPDSRNAHQSILQAVKNGDVDFDQDIILCCRNGDTGGETECSVEAFNRDIKDIVNPNEDGSYTITPGDRVINTQNHSDLDVWNGTTGSCQSIDSDGAVWVKLDYRNSVGEDIIMIPKKYRKEWKLAYALTVHKSQGSQYRKVFFVVSRRDRMNLLSRPMVYTAVTRAKAECNVIGNINSFYEAIRTPETKVTVIQELSK